MNNKEMINNKKIKTLLLTIVISIITLNLFAQIPTDGLVGYWPFNGNANDESGNGNNGTVEGAKLTSDRFGNIDRAYSFDGNDDYISLNNDFTSSNGTVSCWINIQGGGTFLVQTEQSVGQNHRIDFIAKKDTLMVDLDLREWQQQWNASWMHTSLVETLLDTGTWYHVLMMGDGTKHDFYLNGVAVGSLNTGNWPGAWFDVVQQHGANEIWNFIGRSYSSYYQGDIDDIRIYNRTLDSIEINELYNENPCHQTITVTDTLIINMGLKSTAILSGEDTICEGDSAAITINFTGIAPWDVDYTDGVNTFNIVTSNNPYTFYVTTGGIYKVTAFSDANGGGVGRDSAYIFVSQKPTKPVIAIIDHTLQSDFTYGNQWYKESNLIPNAELQFYTPQESGNYSVQVTTIYGCTNLSNEISFIFTDNCYSFDGRVYTGESFLPKGILMLYNVNNQGLPINSTYVKNGDYNFTQICDGDYKLLAIPDSTAADYYQPTYCGDVLNANDAFILNVYGDASSVDIHLIPLVSGINDMFAKENILIYPNPTNGQVNIQLNDYLNEKLNIKISDITGRLIHSNEVVNYGFIRLDNVDLPLGIYFISITDGTYNITKKIIKK